MLTSGEIVMSQAVLDHLAGLGTLARYLTHQETISGTPEQKYFHLTQDWNSLERSHYSSRNQINVRGIKCGHSSSYPLDHY